VREELTDYTPKILITVLAEVAMVEEIRRTIIMICSTGQFGDGLVWTLPIGTMHRIRNGSDMLADNPDGSSPGEQPPA
jgi:nitrogen regulatory protein P-II 1